MANKKNTSTQVVLFPLTPEEVKNAMEAIRQLTSSRSSREKHEHKIVQTDRPPDTEDTPPQSDRKVS